MSRPTALDALRAAWERATEEERTEFRSEIAREDDARQHLVRLWAAGVRVCQLGMRGVRRDDPEFFQVVTDALTAGRCRLELALLLEPEIGACMRVIGQLEGEAGERVVEVFRLADTSAPEKLQ